MPAEIVDQRVLESSDGPIEHVRLVCLAGHWFLMPTEMLPAQAQDMPPRPGRPNRADTAEFRVDDVGHVAMLVPRYASTSVLGLAAGGLQI